MKNSVAKTEKADGEARRAGILAALRPGAEPQSAGALGEKFGVSRQVIVQDIALLRASGASVISTNRGYVLSSPPRAERVFKVRHTEAEVGEELELIVRLGGTVKDVSVSHRVYGNILRIRAQHPQRRQPSPHARDGRLSLSHRHRPRRKNAGRDRKGTERTRLSRHRLKFTSDRKFICPEFLSFRNICAVAKTCPHCRAGFL